MERQLASFPLPPSHQHQHPRNASDASARRVHFSPSTLATSQQAGSPPAPGFRSAAAPPRAPPSSFSAKLRSSLRGLGLSTSKSHGPEQQKRKESAATTSVHAPTRTGQTVPREGLMESHRSSAPFVRHDAVQTVDARPKHHSGPAAAGHTGFLLVEPPSRSTPTPTRPQDDVFAEQRPSSMAYARDDDTPVAAREDSPATTERAGTPPTLTLPALDLAGHSGSTSTSAAADPPYKPKPSILLDDLDFGGGLSAPSPPGATLFNTRIPSMRFDDLDSTFTSDLHKSIYAADGTTCATPPATPRTRPRTRSSPRTGKAKAAVPTTTGGQGAASSARHLSPKRRRRHPTPFEEGKTLPLPTPYLDVQAPQVKVQPPTPVIDEGSFELPLGGHDLSEGFEILNSSSSWLPLDAPPKNTSIRSIADITNDRSPASPGSSTASTPPLSPSSTADSMMNSTCTSLTSPSLMLSNAIDLSSEAGCSSGSPRSRKTLGKARAISSPMDFEADDEEEEPEEEEDGDAQIERLMLDLQRPYSFRKSTDFSRHQRQLQQSFDHASLSSSAAAANSRGAPPPRSEVPNRYGFLFDDDSEREAGLDTLQERFHRKWSPQQEIDDPFHFLARSETDSELTTGTQAVVPSAVHYTSVGRRPHFGDLDFGQLQLDSPASAASRKRERAAYELERDETMATVGSTATKPLHTPEGSLWDLQEAVVCMGDRVEISGFAY